MKTKTQNKLSINQLIKSINININITYRTLSVGRLVGRWQKRPCALRRKSNKHPDVKFCQFSSSMQIKIFKYQLGWAEACTIFASQLRVKRVRANQSLRLCVCCSEKANKFQLKGSFRYVCNAMHVIIIEMCVCVCVITNSMALETYILSLNS